MSSLPERAHGDVRLLERQPTLCLLLLHSPHDVLVLDFLGAGRRRRLGSIVSYVVMHEGIKRKLHRHGRSAEQKQREKFQQVHHRVLGSGRTSAPEKAECSWWFVGCDDSNTWYITISWGSLCPWERTPLISFKNGDKSRRCSIRSGFPPMQRSNSFATLDSSTRSTYANR